MNYLCDTYGRIRKNAYKIDDAEVEELSKCVYDRAVKLILEPWAYYPDQPPHGIVQPFKDCFEMLQTQDPADSERLFSSLLSDLIDTHKPAFDNLILKLYNACLDTLLLLKPKDEPQKWYKVQNAVLVLIQKHEAASLFMRLELGAMSASESEMEYSSVLGNVLRFSFAGSGYALEYLQKNGGNAETLRALRMQLSEALDPIQDRITIIVKKLCRDHELLPQVMSWLIEVSNKNAERHDQSHLPEVSSTGPLLSSLRDG